jgi:hypothetical protein
VKGDVHGHCDVGGWYRHRLRPDRGRPCTDCQPGRVLHAAYLRRAGGANSPAWFRRSVADQAAAIPGARLQMLEGYDHNAPPEVLTPILTEFFGTCR